MAIEKLISISV